MRKIYKFNPSEYITGFFIGSASHVLQADEAEDTEGIIIGDLRSGAAFLYRYSGGVIIPTGQADIDAQNAAAAAKVDNDLDMQMVARKLIKILFNHENRMRTIEGQSTVTIDQFIDYIKTNL